MRRFPHVGPVVLMLLAAGPPLCPGASPPGGLYGGTGPDHGPTGVAPLPRFGGGVNDVQFIGPQHRKVGIETQGAEKNRVYVVTGAISSTGDMLLPGGVRCRTGEAVRVAKWLKDVAEKGPPDQREPTTSMGLTLKQFQATHDALAPAVGFSTKGMDRAEAVRKIAAKLSIPVKLDPAALKAAEGDAVNEELTEVSYGTALASVLRPAGLCLVARPGGSGPELVVLPSKPGLEIWPIGWKLDQPEPKVLPSLFQSFNANVQNVPITTVFDAVSQRLKTPILMDYNALARHGIEPEKTLVSAPQKKISYDSLLRAVCGKAKLKIELRVDEAGKPLFWVTTQLPI